MELSLNQKLNNILSNIDKSNKPNLFLHVCCGPCSTAVLKKLIHFFNIYIIFFNSNIDSIDEFTLRLLQLKKVIEINKYNINIIFDEYNHNDFLNYIKGYEHCKEGGDRCTKCFEFRLNKSYDVANNYIINNNLTSCINYLCTTLSISPHKNAKLIEDIGENICLNAKYMNYLPSDFKKENGFLDSINLSKQLGLYRQNYCGCEFSKNE